MARQTHNDLLDHESLREAVDVPYDNTVSGLTAVELQAAVDELAAGGGVSLSDATPLVESGSGDSGIGTEASRDDHVHPADGGGGGGVADYITGDDSFFTSTVGNWVNSGGTLTRDTTSTYKWNNDFAASLKFVTTATSQYIELPLAGTFTSGTQYQAFVGLLLEELEPRTLGADITLGLIGTDASTWQTLQFNLVAGRYAIYATRWTPTADRTGVKLRINRSATNSTAGTTTLHVGLARAISSLNEGYAGVLMSAPPMTTSAATSTLTDMNGVGLMVHPGSQVTYLNNSDSSSTGLSFDQTGDVGISSPSGEGSFAVYASDDTAYIHGGTGTAATLNSKGVNIQVGADYIGMYIGEKDSSTIQMYPDSASGYDIELRDRGSGKFWYAVNTSNQRVPLSALMNGGIQFVIGGGASAITTGIKGDIEMPFAGVITANRLFADQTGSIVLDLWKDTYANYPPIIGDSITASAKPTLSSAIKSEDTTLTGWTTAFAAGDTIRVNVDSATTLTRVTLALRVRRT